MFRFLFFCFTLKFSAGIHLHNRYTWCYHFFYQQTCERRDLEAQWPCPHLNDPKVIHQNKYEMQTLSDEKSVIECQQRNLTPAPNFWHAGSLVCQKSRNLWEETCCALCLELCAQLVLLSPAHCKQNRAVHPVRAEARPSQAKPKSWQWCVTGQPQPLTLFCTSSPAN